MIFERLWVLPFLLIPLAWLAWEWRRQARRTPLLLKFTMLMVVILALAEPVLETRDRKVALAALVDTSASITPDDLSRESGLLNRIQSERGSNRLDVIPFARAPRALTPAEASLRLQHTDGAAGTRHEYRIAHPRSAGVAACRHDPSRRPDLRRQ